MMRTRRKGRKGPLWRKKLVKSAEPFYGEEIGFRIERALKDSGPKTTILWFEFGAGPWQKSCCITREGVSLHGWVSTGVAYNTAS